MLLRQLLILGLLLVGVARCEVTFRELEHTETPGGGSQQSFVLEDENGNAVGFMHRFQSGGQFGRRMGPGFELSTGPSPLMLQLDSLRSFMDAQLAALPGQLLGQMHQALHAGCPMMSRGRQPEPPAHDEFSMLSQRLGPLRLTPLFLGSVRVPEPSDVQVQELSADANLQSMLGASGEQPSSTLFGQQAAALPGMVASLLDGVRPAQELRPFELKPVAWQQRSWEQHRHQHYVGGDAARTAAQPAPRHQHMMMMMGGGGHDMWQRAAAAAAVEEQARAPALPQVAEERSVDWMALEDSAMPVVGGDSIDWSLYDEDGNLNTGLVCFVVLSAACVGVWAAGIASWLSYRRHAAVPLRCRPQFMTSAKGELLAPLLPEGPMGSCAGSPRLYTGVEFAADHAPKDGDFWAPPQKGGQ